MLGADKRFLVGSVIPGVSLGYHETLEIKVVAGCKISWQSVDEDVKDGSKVQLILAAGNEVGNESGQRVRVTTTSPANACWP